MELLPQKLAAPARNQRGPRRELLEIVGTEYRIDDRQTQHSMFLAIRLIFGPVTGGSVRNSLAVLADISDVPRRVSVETIEKRLPIGVGVAPPAPITSSDQIGVIRRT